MDTISIPVRTALMPLFYRDFHCLAADCLDNCCGGWEIAFHKKDYLKVKRAARSEEMKAILADGMSRLRNNSTGFYAHFNVGEAGRCAFQTKEGLCRLQLECGAEALPEVCRMYPRKIIWTPAAREFSLSPSCDGVLAILMDLPQGIDFLEEDLPKQECTTLKAIPQLARFADIRSLCIDVLQERTLPLSHRMLLLGLMLQRLKERELTEEGAVDEWLAWGGEQLRSPVTAAILRELPRSQTRFFAENVWILTRLYEETAAQAKTVYGELLSAISTDDAWAQEGIDKFFMDTDRYRALEGQLWELLDHSDTFFENLMVLIAFYQTFPILSSPEKLWRSYLDLCIQYSFFHFASVCGCGQAVSRERLFRVIGTVNRGLLHNEDRRRWLLDNLAARGGDTLSSMAVLVSG